MNVRSGPDFDFERTIQAWLELGPSELSDTVVQRARAEIHRTPQRDSWRKSWRLSLGRPRSAAATFVLAAVIVALVGVGARIVWAPVVGTKATPSPAATLRSAPSSTRPSFVPTGSMAVGRIGHTATLLLDGRVLIAGGSEHVTDGNGQPGSVLLASAELYDPTSGTFSPTGSMATARAHHTATLLASGRVLIAGGGNSGAYGGGFALASAELFDPATGTFSQTGSMGSARRGAAATLVAGGLVLIAGGESGGPGIGLDSAELYDEATATFASTGSMTSSRAAPTTALLPDGRVLVAGGSDETSVELYDPASRSFHRLGSLATGGSPFALATSATALLDGRALLVGGARTVGHPTVAAWLFDPEGGAVTPTGQPAVEGWDATATLLADGRVLLAGGFSVASRSQIGDAEIYDPTTGTFTSTAFPRYSLSCAKTGCGSLQRARTGHTATLLLDGRVLIAGGGNTVSNLNRELATMSAEIFQ